MRHISGSAILRKKTRVQNLSNILRRVAAAGLVCVLACAAETQKKVKDQGEYDIYNQAIKDAADPAKQIADLDTWNQKYPDSEYKDDRVYLYMQACLKMNPPQPAKVLEYGGQLMSKDLDAIFNGPAAEQLAGLPIKLTMLNVLYSVAFNAPVFPIRPRTNWRWATRRRINCWSSRRSISRRRTGRPVRPTPPGTRRAPMSLVRPKRP